MKSIFSIFFIILLLAACAPTTETAVSSQPTLETAVLPTATIPPPVITEESLSLAEATAVSNSTEPAVEPTATTAIAAEPTAVEVAAETGVMSGRTEEGAFFLGDPDAPITHIDYSDFLWGSCRAYVLGTEPDIIANYVETGRVKLFFWPVLNHGDPSVYSTLTAECTGQQDPNLFWEMHKYLFANQADLWRADRDYYVNAAVSLGAEQAQFEACYDGPDGIATILELDNIRRQRSVFSQPIFDINGEIFVGAQPYEDFAAVFDALP